MEDGGDEEGYIRTDSGVRSALFIAFRDSCSI